MMSPGLGPAALLVLTLDSTAVSMAIRLSGVVACFRIVRLGRGDGSMRVNEPSSCEHFSCWRRVLLFVRVGVDSVVYFDGSTTLKGAQNSIAACDDLITFFESAEDFDVSGAGDAGGYGDEFDALLLMVGL